MKKLEINNVLSGTALLFQNAFTVNVNFLYYVVSLFTPSWLSWNKFSEGMLRQLEKRILQIVATPYRGFFVDIGPTVGPSDKIWTISLNTESPKTPLVLIHGLGAGVALWCLNLDALAASRPVYAFDLIGFGRSSRPDFSKDPKITEQQMVRTIEEWRKEMKLKDMILLGHSMGGFLAASYAISYPQHIKHLILADPWGFPERPKEFKEVPFLVRAVAVMMSPFNPLAGIRLAGPYGPWLINTLRADISKKYMQSIVDINLIPQYIYQCNSQHPSGESAFHCMMAGYGWAKNPIVKRIDHLHRDIPITLLYGSRTWNDHSANEIIKEKRMFSYYKQQVISGAGHHVYADKPEAFNQIVLEACSYSDGSGLKAIMPNESDKPESDISS